MCWLPLHTGDEPHGSGPHGSGPHGSGPHGSGHVDGVPAFSRAVGELWALRTRAWCSLSLAPQLAVRAVLAAQGGAAAGEGGGAQVQLGRRRLGCLGLHMYVSGWQIQLPLMHSSFAQATSAVLLAASASVHSSLLPQRSPEEPYYAELRTQRAGTIGLTQVRNSQLLPAWLDFHLGPADAHPPKRGGVFQHIIVYADGGDHTLVTAQTHAHRAAGLVTLVLTDGPVSALEHRQFLMMTHAARTMLHHTQWVLQLDDDCFFPRHSASGSSFQQLAAAAPPFASLEVASSWAGSCVAAAAAAQHQLPVSLCRDPAHAPPYTGAHDLEAMSTFQPQQWRPFSRAALAEGRLHPAAACLLTDAPADGALPTVLDAARFAAWASNSGITPNVMPAGARAEYFSFLTLQRTAGVREAWVLTHSWPLLQEYHTEHVPPEQYQFRHMKVLPLGWQQRKAAGGSWTNEGQQTNVTALWRRRNALMCRVQLPSMYELNSS